MPGVAILNMQCSPYLTSLDMCVLKHTPRNAAWMTALGLSLQLLPVKPEPPAMHCRSPLP